jgi:heme-degrading monooxygenase HmoA
VCQELDNLFVFVSQGIPKDGCAKDYLRIAIAAQKAADGHPGLIRYQVLKAKKEDGPITIVSTWESEDAFRAWIKTDAFRVVHGPDVMRQVDDLTTSVSAFGCDVAASWHTA